MLSDALNFHKLSHILHSAPLLYLSFSFTNGFRAPPRNSYLDEPDTGVPFPENVTKIELTGDTLCCYIEEKEVARIEGADGNEAFLVEMEEGERIVAASVSVSQDRIYATSVQFLIYDEV